MRVGGRHYGTVTDLIAINLPAFFARNTDEFLAFMNARPADPATGQPDHAKLTAFAASHPNAARVLKLQSDQPAPTSFAQVSYRPLHTFYFENAAGVGRWARYHWEPEAGVASQPTDQLAKQPHDFLYEEFEARLEAGPVAFRLELELAVEGDPVADPTAMWPDGRERVLVGHVELSRRTLLSVAERTGGWRRRHAVSAPPNGATESAPVPPAP